MTSQAAFVIKIVTIAVPIFMLGIVIAAVWALCTAGQHPLRAILVSIICAAIFPILLKNVPLVVEDSLNQLTTKNPLVYSENKQIASEYRVADLHCDVLLWAGRDFTVTMKHPFISDKVIGHVDLPRLRRDVNEITNHQSRNLKIVNSVPRLLKSHSNKRPTALTDAITIKAVFERWPRNSWFSPKNRVFYAAQRLHKAAEQEDGLVIVRSVHDLPPIDGTTEVNTIHSILAIEGLSSLDNNISTVDAFFDAGVRIMNMKLLLTILQNGTDVTKMCSRGPTHFYDTEVGGSKSGICQCGLSAFGRKVIRRMKELSMIVDLAHAHPRLVSDIVHIPSHERPPVILSHTGVKAVCASERNEDGDTVRGVANAGGLIGVGLFYPTLCGDDWLDTFVQTIRHLMAVTGSIDLIALGSDWDGTVMTVVPSDRTDLLIDALLTRGNFSHQEVQKLMFQNALQFFQKALPIS